MTEIAVKEKLKRTSNFGSGENWKGNKFGRPRLPEIELFREALAKVEKEKDMSLLEHAVRKAFINDDVLIALLKKLLPDKLDFGISVDSKEEMEQRRIRLKSFLEQLSNPVSVIETTAKTEKSE